MSLQRRMIKEIKQIGLITLYFACCFGMMVFLKRLVLAQYEIESGGLPVAILGALVVGKVVAVTDKLPLGKWVRKKPVALDVVVRTLLYTLVVAIVLLLEKAFETRHEAGGFGTAVVRVFRHREVHRVWAGTICVSGALLALKVFSVLRRQLGDRELTRIFFETPLADMEKQWNETRSDSATRKAVP